jgi:hypothetical protein
MARHGGGGGGGGDGDAEDGGKIPLERWIACMEDLHG